MLKHNVQVARVAAQIHYHLCVMDGTEMTFHSPPHAHQTLQFIESISFMNNGSDGESDSILCSSSLAKLTLEDYNEALS